MATPEQVVSVQNPLESDGVRRASALEVRWAHGGLGVAFLSWALGSRSRPPWAPSASPDPPPFAIGIAAFLFAELACACQGGKDAGGERNRFHFAPFAVQRGAHRLPTCACLFMQVSWLAEGGVEGGSRSGRPTLVRVS